MGEVTYTVERANDYIRENKQLVNVQYKPERHFSAEIGWINDPNGFVYFRGEYHLFYQFYPYDSVWGPMHWGHAKSKDLVHWEHLPVALAPDQDYDRNGCFSGSAIVKDNRLWLMYTGHIEEESGVRQVQNMAVSDDGIHFRKISENPVATGEMLPDEIIASDFRDPKVFEKDGHYYAVVAGKHKDGVGCIVLLGSDDLRNWNFESIFLKGRAHQGIMWECPDFFELDGKDCLVMSPMRYEREGDSFHNINSSVFITGTVDWGKKEFIPEQVQEIDHGQDFYAPQTLIDNQGNRLMIAWMQMWGRTLPTDDLKHRWSGSFTIPRQLKFEKGQLRQILLPQVKESFAPIKIGETLTAPSIFSVRLEGSKQFILGNQDDNILFGYDFIRKEVYIDRRNLKQKIAGEETKDTSRRYLTIAAQKLEILIDKSHLEIFVDDGEGVLSSTFYLTVPPVLQEIS